MEISKAKIFNRRRLIVLSACIIVLAICFFIYRCYAAKRMDKILVNANIYTVDSNDSTAEAMVIKDGKIVYVGSNEEAKKFRGPIEDMQGQFIMPGLVDSHVHAALAADLSVREASKYIEADSKRGVINFIKAEIANNPNAKAYRFYLSATDLRGERLTRDELDAICSDKPIAITEAECHSCWVNTKELKARGIDEYAEDVAKGLSYFDRDPDGRVNGRIYEFCQIPDELPDNPQKRYEDAIDFLAKYWKKWGVIAAFDAGQIGSEASVNAFCQAIKLKQESGELPVYMECCYYIYKPKQLKNAVANLKKLREKYNTDMLHVRTMKMMSDGTIIGRNAAIFENYEDTNGNGGTIVDPATLTDFLCEMNDAGIEYFHVHTVGERAVVMVQDAVQEAKKRLGDKFALEVTTAHVECLPEKYFPRFKELGILVNYTPFWFGGDYEAYCIALGKDRIVDLYKAKTLWESGAFITFSSDSVTFDNMKHWNPYQGMEVGMTRQDGDFLSTIDDDFSSRPVVPLESERLTLKQMIRGFTINGARQMGLDDKIGSLEVGKDASYLVFKKSLFDVDVYKLHKQLPDQVYIKGKLVK